MGANRLWTPKQIFPVPGTVFVKYLERIPSEVVEKSTLPELQDIVRKAFKDNMQTLDDSIVFNTDNKPYKWFFMMLAFLVLFWVSIVKIFL